MAQSQALVQTLKRTLRAARITYADIAGHLDMSEANIKRLFATQSFTLQRLESICEMMNMDLGDLFHLHESARERIQHLTRKQEQELVGDTRLLLVAVCVRNRLGFEEIAAGYRLTEPEIIRCLARLDRLGIIELLPGNRIKLLIDDNFDWLSNGPIERFYQQQIQEQFLDANFAADIESRQFQFGLLGESSCLLLKKKLRELAREFTELHHSDLTLPLNKRYNVGLLLAMRPWELTAFKPLLKEEASPPAQD
ncbi:MAG: helix-turn-helix transcriptional regulator [Gammaproteobacteria bacterium]|nr:helix-turn-helix transcriptional regulator [Gammaproteobacteria bacterium]